MDGHNCAWRRAQTRVLLVALLLGFIGCSLGASQAWMTPTASAAGTATFGNTSVGGSSDWFAANRKRVNSYVLPIAGAISELSVYLAPTPNSGQQAIRGIVYGDSGGVPGALLGTSSELTFASTSAAGWYQLTFPAPLELPAGEYWIGILTGPSAGIAGYRYDSVAGARYYNPDNYAELAPDPFGSFSTDNEQMSLYATYTPIGPVLPPASLRPPAISGTAQSGEQLTASPGSWTASPTGFSYQWQRCDSTGANCSEIAGATAQSYTVGAPDLRATLRVSVTASSPAGSSAAESSAQTAVVTPLSPAFGKTTVGAITDNGMFANFKIVHQAQLTVAGSVTKLSLYAIPGVNSPNPQALMGVIYSDSGGSPAALLATGTEVTYRGNVNGSGWFDLPFASPVTLPPGTYWLGFITGESSEGIGYVYDRVPNSRAYNPNPFESGPTDPFGLATKDSQQASIYATYTPAAAPPPPVDVTPPTVSGTAQSGEQLSASSGSWTESPTGFTYQWLRCDSTGANCAPIANAAAQTYVLSAEDVGHTLRVAQTASNEGGASSPAESQATGVVVTPPLESTAPPTITGTAQQGQTLIEVRGSWTNGPTSFANQWLRCDSHGANCAPIAKATTQTYVLASADVGHTLRVAETASNASGSSSPAESQATSVVAPTATTNTAPPRISGSAQQGEALTEVQGAWTNEPTGFAYQWLRCDSTGANCAMIANAIAQTYVLTAADVGHTLRVTETASNAGGSGSAAESQATGVVAPALPVNTALPTISGVAQQGQTLSEEQGTWTNEPTGFAYRWLRCDSTGASCSAIPGATAQTYTIASADLKATLRISVTASNSAGSSATASSAQTAVVSEAPPAEAIGHLKYRLDAKSYFDSYAGETAFLQTHVARIMAYPPFGDRYIATGIPVLAYHDYFTEFTQKGIPLSPASRAEYVEKVKRDVQKGYAGQFMDDANMAGGNIPGSRAELANLTEDVRRAVGPNGIIEWNAQYHDLWPLMKAGDPEVARALAQVNVVTKEFGVGGTAGINTAKDYGELLTYIDTLHAKGIHVTMTGDLRHPDAATMEYNLATYLLANDGGDFVNGHNQTPGNWWSGFGTNVGEPTSPRERLPSGVWRRQFSGGVVYTVEPGAATQTIKLGRPMVSAEWGTVESVTLAAGQGAVLVG
jgi:hypothetical protein